MAKLARVPRPPAAKEVTDDELWPIRNRLTALRFAIQGLATDDAHDENDVYALADVAQRITSDLYDLTH